jgi:hypothetical protein
MEVRGHINAACSFILGEEPPVPIGKEAGWAPRAVLDEVARRKTSQLLPGITPFVQFVA